MTILYKNNIEFKISPNEHPYLNGAWSPCREEVDAVDMEVIGEIPKDISGIYVRNTENPVRDAIGIYHPFDGDGMIHAMSFHNGQAKYSNRLVQTKGLKAEQEAGHALWTGIAGNPAKSAREGWGARGRMKDSSSTDVVVVRLFFLPEQSSTDGALGGGAKVVAPQVDVVPPLPEAIPPFRR